MKIDNSATRTSILGESGAPAARSAKPATGPENRSTQQDSVQLSSVSTQIQALETGLAAASGFDAAKVEAIRQAILEGRYTVNAEAIADKLIASTRELLARQG